MPSNAPVSMASPCLQVCLVDGRTRHCVGCYRTLAEIARWSRLTDAERDDIMRALPGRGERIRAESLARGHGSLSTDAAS